MNLNVLFEDRNSFASQLIRKKAGQLVRHPGFRRSDQRDIEQEFAVELLLKYRHYDPGRARETTFVARVIENKAVSLVRARTAQKRDYRRESNSLNETINDPDGSRVERSQTINASAARNHTGHSQRADDEWSQLQIDVAGFIDRLPDDLRLLAELLQVMSEYRASCTLGKPRRQVANDKARLLKLSEDAGLREFL